jgi:hypothetical protein
MANPPRPFSLARQEFMEGMIRNAVQRVVNIPASSGIFPLVNHSQFQHYRPPTLFLSADQIPIQQSIITRFENSWMDLYRSIPSEQKMEYLKGFTLDQQKLHEMAGLVQQIQAKLAEHIDPATGASQLSSEKLPLFLGFLSGDETRLQTLNAMSGGKRRKRCATSSRKRRTIKRRKTLRK